MFSIYTTLHSYTWYLQALGNRLQYCIYTRKWVGWDNFFYSWVKRLLRLWKLEEKSQPMSCACKCFAGWRLQRALSCHRRFFECLGSQILLPESWCTLIDVSERNVWTPSAETTCWCTTYSMMSELEVGNESTKTFVEGAWGRFWFSSNPRQHNFERYIGSSTWGSPSMFMAWFQDVGGTCIGPPAFPENVPLQSLQIASFPSKCWSIHVSLTLCQ